LSEAPVERMPQDQSILASIKKILNLHDTYTEFDTDVVLHINSVFPVLQQLGIGPANGFMIDGREVSWSEYLGDDLNLNNVKTYVALRVRMLFDPPGTSYHINAMEEQIKELEWRLNVHREGTAWLAQTTLQP
jgi:hypothetical protein